MSLRDFLPLDVTSNAEPREKRTWGRGDLTGEDGREGDGEGCIAPEVQAVSSPSPQSSDVRQDLTVEASLSVDRPKTSRIGSRVQPKPGDWAS